MCLEIVQASCNPVMWEFNDISSYLSNNHNKAVSQEELVKEVTYPFKSLINNTHKINRHLETVFSENGISPIIA